MTRPVRVPATNAVTCCDAFSAPSSSRWFDAGRCRPSCRTAINFMRVGDDNRVIDLADVEAKRLVFEGNGPQKPFELEWLVLGSDRPSQLLH